MDKGKGIASSDNSGSSVRRERSRSPPSQRPAAATSSPRPPGPQPPTPSGSNQPDIPIVPGSSVARFAAGPPFICPVPECGRSFDTMLSRRGHLGAHSKPPSNNSAVEAWEAILNMHGGNPPPELVQLFRPQLEHEAWALLSQATVPNLAAMLAHAAATGSRAPANTNPGESSQAAAAPAEEQPQVPDLNIVPTVSDEEKGADQKKD